MFREIQELGAQLTQQIFQVLPDAVNFLYHTKFLPRFAFSGDNKKSVSRLHCLQRLITRSLAAERHLEQLENQIRS